mmetsp:Transcript_15881/g.29086  ORF Transcript_15881/g.29086 Transcript_15881/m.29086 type:complete len:149 (+) Transcript_15881:1118-1564(+)
MESCKVLLLPSFKPKHRLKPKRDSPYQSNFLVVPRKPKSRFEKSYSRKPPKNLPALSLSSKSLCLKTLAKLDLERSIIDMTSESLSPKAIDRPISKAKLLPPLPEIKFRPVRIEIPQRTIKLKARSPQSHNMSFDSPLSGWDTVDNTI